MFVAVNDSITIRSFCSTVNFSDMCITYFMGSVQELYETSSGLPLTYLQQYIISLINVQTIKEAHQNELQKQLELKGIMVKKGSAQDATFITSDP